MAEPSNTASPVAETTPNPGENGEAGTADGANESSGVSEGNTVTDSKPNGATTPNKPHTSEAQAGDTEMKDQENEAEATSTPAVTQTPASSKKATNGSSKKKSAVPEHKTKKLNKKASSKRLTNLDAEPGQYYLARMKGHPPWPSVICDEEMLPMSLLDTRPVTTRLPDGTYKKAEYANGGKRVHDRTFPIMFFAWMPNTDLSPLDTAAIDPTDTKGKSKPLAAAYAKASEENDLQHYKDMLADHQKAVEEEQLAQAERDAKKSAKAKRKSADVSATPADDDDEMDVDEEEEEPKPKSKKRKKEAESDEEEKPAKTPKTATKLKLSTPKTPAETSSKKKAPKAKTSSKKAPKESDDDAVETPKVEQKRMTSEEARVGKEKKVLWFRHKLQRGFLSRDVPPKEDEMKQMSDYLGELETYLDLESSIIRSTKINKVLKAMIKIPSIPQDEIHQFKDRSLKLLGEWNKALSNEPGNDAQGDKEDDGKETAAPTTNGTTKNTEAQAAKAETGEAAAPEEENDEALEGKIGTTTEGEKEAEKSEGKPAEEPQKVSDDKGDEPDVESAPAKEYQPPAVEAA
ncbi:MAG: hypothetical protein Q9213_005938 [Squamulea squamosa]